MPVKTLSGSLNEIKEIKIVLAYNDRFFVCFSNDSPICLINDYSYEFQEIECRHNNTWLSEYKVLYFNETGYFIIISRRPLKSTIYNKLKIQTQNVLNF